MINLEHLKSSLNIVPDKKILVAVSGGVDSMVLLWLFRYFYQKDFSVAHINYKLRGKDSDLDQELVEDFCKKNQIEYHIYVVSEKDNRPKNGSIQLWARELRYQFFREIMEREQLHSLATAHHLEDQLETFLINLSRGTGIRGLCGIRADEHSLVRPLLGYSKQDIYDFAHQYNIPYREDKSNQKMDYMRNKIRHQITPILKEINPNFLQNFQKTIGFLEDTKDVLEEKIERVFQEISSERNGKISLDKKKLKSEKDIVQFEILRKFGFENSLQIRKIFTADVGCVFYSENYQLLVDRQLLIISKLDTDVECVSEFFFNKEEVQSVDSKFFSLNIPHLGEVSACIFLDMEKIKFPLKLRKAKREDVFYPVGMQGKKKVSKYFKDEKYSVFQKEETPILVDANENVLWIIPNRQDRRFFANEKTQKMLKVVLVGK